MELLYLFDSSSDEEEQRNFNLRRPRVFRPRVIFPRHVSTFREEFRVDAPVADLILNRIGHLIAHPPESNHALSPREQLLTVLRFLGTNAPYHSICNMQGPNKSTVCRTLFRVVNVLNETLFGETVRFPDHSTQIPIEFSAIAGRILHFASKKEYIILIFYVCQGLPNIYGCVDGSLIRFEPLRIFEAGFVDRHQNHSVNLTVVCGPRYQFFFACAFAPGSWHDARVLRASNLWQAWENGMH